MAQALKIEVMEAINMNGGSLELFVKLFLSECRLLNEPVLELDRIARILYGLFKTDNYPVFISALFETFFKLHYPISVVEPVRQTDLYKPYTETNSRYIYIAVDPDKVSDIKKLSEIMSGNDPVIPCGLKELYNALHQFANDSY
ncbi:MAG: hypothetical protein ACLGH8_14865 [Bacteroidia bacterium]